MHHYLTMCISIIFFHISAKSIKKEDERQQTMSIPVESTDIEDGQFMIVENVVIENADGLVPEGAVMIEAGQDGTVVLDSQIDNAPEGTSKKNRGISFHQLTIISARSLTPWKLAIVLPVSIH